MEGANTQVKDYTYNIDQNRLMGIVEKLNNDTQNHYDYTYDNNGNLLTETRTPYVNETPQTPVIEITNTYDVWNELTQSVKGATTIVNTYNGEGLRVQKSVNGSATNYLYEYSSVVLETNASNLETARNVYGTNLIIREASYYYDAFGNIMKTSGNGQQQLRYAGNQYDTEAGYYYLNARMYDPLIARFLQEDTYTGDPNDPLSLNLYTYVNNNPLIYYEPTGLIGEDLYNYLIAYQAGRNAMTDNYKPNNSKAQPSQNEYPGKDIPAGV